MIPYEELAAENVRLLGIIKTLKAENAVLRSMLPPEAKLPTRSNEPEAKPKQLDREAIIAQRLSLFRSLFRGREWGIQPCIERSRSGKGAHVWIFFREAVPAIKARKLGFAILREAMNHNGRMELNSYDRFLPNQDFLPKGGYGNLIALPLQGGARRSGNSVFVDNDFIAYDDQWQFLSSIQKLSQEDIDKQICSHICELELSTSCEDKPWITPKPREISFEDFTGEVEVIKANRIYLPLNRLSAKAVSHIKRGTIYQSTLNEIQIAPQVI